MKSRIISAIFMLLIFIPVLVAGGDIFLLLVGLLGMLGLREMIMLREKDDYKLPFFVKTISYLSLLYIIFNNSGTGLIYLDLDYRLISLLIFVFLIPVTLIANDKKYSFLDGFYLMGSVFLIGFSFNLAVLIRETSLNIFIFLLLITTITDSFAFITGKMIGKYKLCPTLSPNKTVEGLIGGSIMGTFIPVVFYLTIVNTNVNMISIILVTLSLSLIGQLGDLVFSSIKRCYKVKDFSNMIPGHGGILDRVDSLVFVILMYVFFIGII